jgi:hypothetical protein
MSCVPVVYPTEVRGIRRWVADAQFCGNAKHRWLSSRKLRLVTAGPARAMGPAGGSRGSPVPSRTATGTPQKSSRNDKHICTCLQMSVIGQIELPFGPPLQLLEDVRNRRGVKRGFDILETIGQKLAKVPRKFSIQGMHGTQSAMMCLQHGVTSPLTGSKPASSPGSHSSFAGE